MKCRCCEGIKDGDKWKVFICRLPKGTDVEMCPRCDGTQAIENAKRAAS